MLKSCDHWYVWLKIWNFVTKKRFQQLQGFWKQGYFDWSALDGVEFFLAQSANIQT